MTMDNINKGYDWEKNLFWSDIRQRLGKAWSGFSGSGLTIDRRTGIWTQGCSHSGASQIAFLQNKYVAVDVTDRGFGICPMILGGRYYGRISFDIECCDDIINTHPWEASGQDGYVQEMKALFEFDSFTLKGMSRKGPDYTVKTCLPPHYPFMLVDIDVKGLRNTDIVLKPHVLWMPGELGHSAEYMLWLNPNHISAVDPVLASNNSRTADPARPEDKHFAGLGIAYGNSTEKPRIYQRLRAHSQKHIGLCDRLFPAESVEILELYPVRLNLKDGEAHFSIILGVCEYMDEFKYALDRWNASGAAECESERRYWSDAISDLYVHCPDCEIELQSRYSVKNSIFSRSKYGSDSTIFIHGRPDRGYGDCSKLHQSYQMHYVALASGHAGSVRDELIAFAQLQGEKGELAVQLRPGTGYHPYVGLYSNAHFIMALYRYLSWTGDFDFVYETATNRMDGSDRTTLETARLAARQLLDNLDGSVVKPCGWLDAWPPKVKAQAQISIATYIALDELSEILDYLGYENDAGFYVRESQMLAENIKSVFYNEENGLFAEHLFEDCKVEGGSIKDFWTHTQIWAALAGLAPDQRGLEACRKYCLKNGMAVIPETGLYSGYIKDSTDGNEDLSLDSTATWLLAAWPELTHLYAIAEAKYGRADEALDAVRRQLPHKLHASNPHASPFYYAEKYLYPQNLPWLCTWSGDPTLIQVLMEGFGGIKPALAGLKIMPYIPKAWKGSEDYQIGFIWRGKKMKLTIKGNGNSIGKIELDGHELKAGTVINPEMLINGVINEITVTVT